MWRGVDQSDRVAIGADVVDPNEQLLGSTDMDRLAGIDGEQAKTMGASALLHILRHTAEAAKAIEHGLPGERVHGVRDSGSLESGGPPGGTNFVS